GVVGIGPVGAERAFAADPDVVLIGVWPGARESLMQHPLLSRLRAVRESRIVEMPTELLVALSQHASAACWLRATSSTPRTRAGTWPGPSTPIACRAPGHERSGWRAQARYQHASAACCS